MDLLSDPNATPTKSWILLSGSTLILNTCVRNTTDQLHPSLAKSVTKGSLIPWAVSTHGSSTENIVLQKHTPSSVTKPKKRAPKGPF